MSKAIKAVSGSLGFGSGNAGKQPGIVRPRDIINKILGVSTKEVKDANGNITYVTDWALSPEEEQRMNELESAYDSYLADLNAITEIGAAISNPAYEPVINAVRDNQRQARTEAFEQRTKLEEDTLARRGLADSRASTELRESRGAALQKQITTDENNLALMAEDLRNQQYQRTANALNFAASSLFNQKQQAANQGNANAQIAQGMFGAENNLNQSLWQARVAQDQQIFKNLTGLAQSAAFAASGGMGGGGGAGGLGSLFGQGGAGAANGQNLGYNWNSFMA